MTKQQFIVKNRLWSGTRRVALSLAPCLFAIGMAGCGGGQSSVPSVAPSPGGAVSGTTRPEDTPALLLVQPDLTVQWGARARAASAPSSASSVVVTIRAGRRDGTDQVWKINRSLAPAGYMETYTAPDAVLVGPHDVAFTFYAGPDGTGEPVASAALSQALITETNPDLGAVSVANRVASVEVTPVALVLDETKPLIVTARDASGTVVAVDDSARFVRLESGDAVTLDGLSVSGRTIGVARVIATVDGVDSAPTPITSVFDGDVILTPTETVLTQGATMAFTASVSRTTDQSVTWSVATTDGGDAGLVTPDGVFKAPERDAVVSVRATSNFDPTKSATATVTVRANGINAVVR